VNSPPKLTSLRTAAWLGLLPGAAAIFLVYEIGFANPNSGSLSLLDPFALWQLAPLVLTALLLHERVMTPATVIAATLVSVGLTALEFFTTDWESSTTAAIGIIYTPILPLLAASLCLFTQVGAATLRRRIRRNSV
jgi:hypothetical protein